MNRKYFARKCLPFYLLFLLFFISSQAISESQPSFEVEAFSNQEQLPLIPNFQTAKRWAKRIHHDHRFTFYCNCEYDKHHKINLKSCGYKVQGDIKRAKRVEWEHIVPVSLWGRHFACWREPLCCDNPDGTCYKGRKCCEKIDARFNKMEADLHNLVPEIGELNACRSNYRFGLLPHIQPGQFGACEIKIDAETRRVEPQKMVRGMIARTYLYMSKQYDIPLSDSQQQLFNAWNNEYPPSNWEIIRDKRIARIQGNHNPFISEYEEYKDNACNNLHYGKILQYGFYQYYLQSQLMKWHMAGLPTNWEIKQHGC